MILRWLVVILAGLAGAAEPLRVCATVPDLGSLAQRIGGADVTVTVLALPSQDAHRVEARPSFIIDLAAADCLVQVGRELEIAWLPALLVQAKNPKLRLGSPGHIDASSALDGTTPDTVVSQGHVHAAGDPHYLVDPIHGWLVARLLAQRFTDLRPQAAAAFAAHLDTFEQHLARSLAGASAIQALGARGVLEACRTKSLDPALVGPGTWLARLKPMAGTKVVVDHDQWGALAQRYGLVVVGSVEPHPGIPATAKHLMQLIELMKAQGITTVLSSPVYDPRSVQTVLSQTSARVVVLPHQSGALPGTEDYLAFAQACVDALAAP